MALAALLFASRAHAQQAEEPGRSGTTLGTVLETTDKWILVRRPDGLPLRILPAQGHQGLGS